MLATPEMTGMFTGLSEAEPVHSRETIFQGTDAPRPTGGCIDGVWVPLRTNVWNMPASRRERRGGGQLGLGRAARSPGDTVWRVRSALVALFHTQSC